MSDLGENDKLLKKNKATLNAYMKYSGMGIQMALIIVILSYAGLYLDIYFNTNPIFTVIFSLTAVLLAMYLFIRQVIGEKKPGDAVDKNIEK